MARSMRANNGVNGARSHMKSGMHLIFLCNLNLYRLVEPIVISDARWLDLSLLDLVQYLYTFGKTGISLRLHIEVLSYGESKGVRQSTRWIPSIITFRFSRACNGDVYICFVIIVHQSRLSIQMHVTLKVPLIINYSKTFITWHGRYISSTVGIVLPSLRKVTRCTILYLIWFTNTAFHDYLTWPHLFVNRMHLRQISRFVIMIVLLVGSFKIVPCKVYRHLKLSCSHMCLISLQLWGMDSNDWIILKGLESYSVISNWSLLLGWTALFH